MSRVDFYILPEQGNQSRAQFACALTGKAWKAGNRVGLLADDRQQAGALDDQLWTFRDISFVPHALTDSSDAATVPVVIGWQADALQSAALDVLINLANSMPSAAGNFARIAEIVGGNETERQAARQRYREYRNQGHELHNHTIEA